MEMYIGDKFQKLLWVNRFKVIYAKANSLGDVFVAFYVTVYWRN